MGVDFLVCERCGDTFPDCGDFVRCDCSRKWCSDQCAEEDGFKVEEDETGEYEDDKSCNYCRGESADDPTLLSFLLTRFALTREEVLTLWKNSLNSSKVK